jgi:hypothetical protein
MTSKGHEEELGKALQSDRPSPSIMKSCIQCQDWVTMALSNISSRPQQLLNSMGFHLARDQETGNFSVSASSTHNTLSKEPLSVQRWLSSRDGVKESMDRISAHSQHYRDLSSEGKNVAADAASHSRALIASSVEAKEDQIQPHHSGKNNSFVSSHRTGSGCIAAKSTKYNRIKNDMEISCTTCSDEGPEGAARAYVKGPNPLCIVLCANRLSSKEEVEEVLVHELMHVYDVRVREMDLRCATIISMFVIFQTYDFFATISVFFFPQHLPFFRDCVQLAYSEVRAAREAECFSSTRFFKAVCVKDRATIATKNMFPSKGQECVRQVFEDAMKDHTPFTPVEPKSFGIHSKR